MRFKDGERWWQYRGTTNYALGTSLCYRRDWWRARRFRSLQVGEDNQFVSEADALGQLITADAGELMYATIHAGNTSPRKMGSAFLRL
jgi:O-antigen biosynthesis protein